MDEKPQIYKALLAAQKAMGPVKKDAQNPHFRNKYASLESVLDTIEGPLQDNGLLMVQTVEIDDVTDKPVLVTRIYHAETGDFLQSRAPLVCKDPDNPQALGGAITYMRRYSLMALLGLTPEDDDGNGAARPAPPRQENRQETRPNPPQSATLAVNENDGEPEVVSWTVFWDEARAKGVFTKQQYVELTQKPMPETPQHALNRLRKTIRERDAALSAGQLVTAPTRPEGQAGLDKFTA